jgi:hypothetical protein
MKQKKEFIWTEELVKELCLSFYPEDFAPHTLEKIENFKKSKTDIAYIPCLSFNDVKNWAKDHLHFATGDFSALRELVEQKIQNEKSND